MPDKSLLFIHALTGLHPGGGTALGVVDLPVQRERHTHWPTIPGSSLKGVMRAECARLANDRQDENILQPLVQKPGMHLSTRVRSPFRTRAFSPFRCARLPACLLG